MSKFLATSDANGHEAADPIAFLVELEINTPFQLYSEILKKLEFSQPGVMRRGGSIKEILADLQKLGIRGQILSTGRKSEYKDTDLEVYKLISGNY